MSKLYYIACQHDGLCNLILAALSHLGHGHLGGV